MNVANIISLILLLTSVRAYKVANMHMMAAGKGFGVAKKVEVGELSIKPTRATAHRKVLGQYAKILAKESNEFDIINGKTEEEKTILDIYARLEQSEICWFIGKIAHSNDMDSETAMQYRAERMKEYAKSLRPKELASPSALDFPLQLWYAQGNTEMSVAQNKISLTQLPSNSAAATDDTNIATGLIGFQPEIYQGGEEGFRCKRDADGNPLGSAFEVKLEDPSVLEQQ
mmetsp:Transcript_27102/g.45391  ORF Transcript_27102/g.45391 Transcript_27102/m.45391 type:complete len:229 (-) Transcript_27102:227-913(-)